MFSDVACTANEVVHHIESLCGQRSKVYRHRIDSPSREHKGNDSEGSDSSPTSKLQRGRLKCLRSNSILSSASSGLSLSDHSHNHDLGVQDSMNCNRANMPNKITGEMGLQITFTQDEKYELALQYQDDRHYRYIHPNVFGPACMSNVRRMGGGGSGVAVFCGKHSELGDIVMKHGGFDDMKELFALSKISTELKTRGGLPTNESSPASNAARSIIACLPEFKMVYISPQHLEFKERALWGKLKKLIKFGNLVSKISNEKQPEGSFATLISKMKHADENASHNSQTQTPKRPSLVSLDDSAFLSKGTSIRIYEGEHNDAEVYLDAKDRKQKPSLVFVVPKKRIKTIHPTSIELECAPEFDPLQQIYDGLYPMMTKHLFKFTLAQKRIGGEWAKTGNQWLYEGRLDGLLLTSLISGFVQTVHNLQLLTMPEEVEVVEQVRREVESIKSSDVEVKEISLLTDQFMGNAIKKNFDPDKGRMRLLRSTCKKFLQHILHLEPEEQLPARCMGILGEATASMSDVFVGATTEPPRIHPNKDFWITLMTQAVSNRIDMSPNATKRIWTSGLTDAGIHNLFVSMDHLYFFDLGVPQLQSLPGFMTKFLFSFFHTLGMQEDTNNSDIWVCRFVPQDDKLALTAETENLLAGAYDAFEFSLDRIIDEIFDGDHHLRWLLLQYVTLQLLSDASFCLQRWNMKGGGRPRDDNHNQGLEKWLWRALWDMYVAYDINSSEAWERFQVEHPSCEESRTSIGDDIRKSMARSMFGSEFFELQSDSLRCLIDTIDDEKEEEEEKDEINAESTRSRLRKRLSKPRHANPRQRRWTSESLEKSSLRQLTAATFDYHDDVPGVEHSDLDSSSYDDDDDDSSSLPADLELPEKHNMTSVKTYVSMDSVLEKNEE